jgi:predicted AlkP superfamily phosphohydrolase/phosphomutase
MVQEVRRGLRIAAFLFASLVAPLCLGQRLIVVTLDGLGHEIVTTDPVAAELSVLRETIAAGAFADGMRATWPALTAVSHASIWTGAGPEVNGVAFNNPPAVPRSEHRVDESTVGFQGTRLLAEPFWVAAGRQGIKALAYQPTQGFPFTSVNTGPGATVINSYQTRMLAPYAVFQGADVAWAPDGGFTFRHGTRVYRASVRPGMLEIGLAGARGVLVPLARAEQEPPRKRELARHFRALLLDGAETGVFFRLFEFDGGKRRLRLLASAALEIGWHDGTSRRVDEVRAMIGACGPALGNGATTLLSAGTITEAEYLETAELAIRQLTRQAAWAGRRLEPRLALGYLPYPDEFDHEWIALARASVGRFAEFRRWGYVALNRGMEAYRELAGAGDWLLWASDHGMAEIKKSVSIAEAMANAGLETSTRVLYNSIVVNTADWKDGLVAPHRKAGVIQRARNALEGLRDPESGMPVVTRIVAAGEEAPACEACGDLYFDMAPGYRSSPSRDSRIVKTLEMPEGAHGFAPARKDMLAVFAARGPGIPAGSIVREMRTIDIAPMICGLLGIEAPRQSRGRRPRVEIRSTP